MNLKLLRRRAAHSAGDGRCFISPASSRVAAGVKTDCDGVCKSTCSPVDMILVCLGSTVRVGHVYGPVNRCLIDSCRMIVDGVGCQINGVVGIATFEKYGLCSRYLS